MLFQIGKKYNFTTVAAVTLGATYKNMKVKAMVDFDTAIKFEDVVTVRQKIIQETGLTLLKPTDVLYIMFENIDGKTVILAQDWIVQSSIVLVEKINVVIKIIDISTEDVPSIKDVLVAMGYTPEIEVINADDSR